jgi:hypothetical protein
MLAGRQAEIHAARDRKLEQARHHRQLRREAVSPVAHSWNATTMTSQDETEAGSPKEQAVLGRVGSQAPWPVRVVWRAFGPACAVLAPGTQLRDSAVVDRG